MKRYVLIPNSSNISLATKQTLQDITNFSSELGFIPIQLPQRTSVVSSLLYYSKLLKSLLADVLLIPYPAVGNPVKTTKLRILDNKVLEALSKNISSLILYVYDLPLEQIAYTKSHNWPLLIDDIAYSLEANLFDFADKILVFNKEMAEVIQRRYGVSRKKFIYYEILDLGIEDFGVGSHFTQRKFDHRKIIVYSGNLSMERIGDLGSNIKKLPAGVELWLIGPNGEWLNKLDLANVKYLGVFKGASFLSKLKEGDFGLVWYPTHLASYLKFSSSSKFSSYMVAGLPVLADAHARYVAEIVKKYKVGIVGRNLLDLFIKASQLDRETYHELRNNALSLGNKIKSGYFIKRALRAAIGVK